MPRKVRELKADLRRAGYHQVKKRGKGSHSMWRHPLVADPINLSGHNGTDARDYQEKMVDAFIERAQEAERSQER